MSGEKFDQSRSRPEDKMFGEERQLRVGRSKCATCPYKDLPLIISHAPFFI